jgi:hypothetical protein
MQRSVCVAIVLGSLGGCAASAPSSRPPPSRPRSNAPAQAQRAAPLQPAPAQPVAQVTSAMATEPVVLPDQVEAGQISRAKLKAVLSAGVGRFLGRLRAEPQLENGRFVGWRLLNVFDRDPQLHDGVLHPGDTVMRVNGQSIERPEQFKNVWDSLASSSELVLQVQRAGKPSEVRYRIVD